VGDKMRVAPISGCGTIRRHISFKVTFGIHFLIAPLGECDFIFSAFEPHLPLVHNRLIA